MRRLKLLIDGHAQEASEGHGSKHRSVGKESKSQPEALRHGDRTTNFSTLSTRGRFRHRYICRNAPFCTVFCFCITFTISVRRVFDWRWCFPAVVSSPA